MSARDSDNRQTMSEVFIVEAVIDEWLDLDASFRLLEMQEFRVEKKISLFCDPSPSAHPTF
jgi:hypothetical protein